MTNFFMFGRPPEINNSALMSTEQLHALEGNTGNTAFRKAISSHISDITDFQDHRDNLSDFTANTIGIIPASNHLGTSTDFSNRANKLQKYDGKLVMIGLGAQSNLAMKIPDIPEGTIRWIDEIIKRKPSKSPNISLRGEFSMSVAKQYGFADHCVTLGCPSLFINPDPELGAALDIKSKKIRRVAVAAGNHKWKNLAGIEQNLARIVEETHGTYIVQSPFEMYKLARCEAEYLPLDAQTACHQYIRPDLSLEQFFDWCKLYTNIFFDFNSWMEHLRHFDFVIGARIHGIMLGMQAGVPGVVIAHDSRTLELCQTMNIPYVLPKQIRDNISVDDLMGLVDFDPVAFDKNRMKLLQKYLQFLDQNGLTPTRSLGKLQQ